MSFDVDIGHASASGPRPVNEDFVGALRSSERGRGVVAALADGVSTGGRGREAAQSTVMGLLADFFATPETWQTTVVFDRLISAQNGWLADHNRRRSREADGTALTTLTALALRGQTWTVAHVGDSRAWLLRDEAEPAPEPQLDPAALRPPALLQPLTQDHAFEALDLRSRLTRAVGLDDVVRIDHLQGEARIGDSFVLSSDGVHGVLKPAAMSALLRGAATAQQAAEALVEAALQAGGRDNASALVLRVTGLDERDLHDERAQVHELPVPALLKVGELLDGYQITARVADNGIHRLYQARDVGSGGAGGPLVAIKTLHPSRASDAEERTMLAHEAWLALRVAGEGEAGAADDPGEPGFVRVHARRRQATALYWVYDWHGGRTMEQLAADGALPTVGEVVAAAQAVALALGRLHRLGVVHRDIKPGNLHRGDDGRWRVLDLGAAISGRESAAQRELHAGTPSYMNPEQWQGAAADAASDLFALAVSLYQWLTGRLPYGEVEPYQLGRYRRDPVPVSRLRPDVPMWLDHLLAKALAREPRERFETAEELLLALQRGAARPLAAPRATPLLQRDPAALLKAALGVSLLFNGLLIVWLLFLPR
ncbi:MAG: protein kinase [Burkholderiaceae bacterium]|nr:protein kinase [Burkholderiaceae bacterium]